jgi:hypothetical protein
MTQKEKILHTLISKGNTGADAVELQGLFILNYRSRISELRVDGYDIEAVPIKGKPYSNYILKDWQKHAQIGMGL